MSFEINDRNLRRAGLDYWPYLNWKYYENLQKWQGGLSPESRCFLFSTKATKSLYQAQFREGDWLVFGKETKGLDPNWVREAGPNALTIPQIGPVRSLNLATAVAVSIYEGFRQTQCSREGNL